MALIWLFKLICTSLSQLSYSGVSNPAGKALGLVDKYTRCSFSATEEAAEVELPRK